MKILIDNGHGENTPGKRSPDSSLREYAYTREIAGRIVNKLKGLGYDAELVVREILDVPLAERCRRVNSYCNKLGSKNVLVVSVHCNAAGNGQWMNARGWCAFTSKGQTKSDTLAEYLYKEARVKFAGMKIREDRRDGDSDLEEGFYILRNTKCAAVLTENFFMDNHEDVEYLLSAAGKSAIVDVHVDGITKYVKSL